ncbi:MAG: EamA/RhaT family transporter [Acidobacteria bacterium]|nr:MAG: EamA/RhaT family transporter [Acidobacteriota bacterium]REK02552.1 MAG: EamA/RhaT family transporter [Acidobacteriota bacterium]REK13645.1 MAG: EamA/RhaT family transporter [Acidobacteriota bacterium]REK41639.1 MAG: EamA/RhaT family transporter [Acidobacteriota bacterium]
MPPEKSNPESSFSPIWLVVFAVLLWSTGGLFIKFTSLDAVSVNFGRALFAAITVAVYTFRKGLGLNWFTIISSVLYATTLSAFVYANKNTTAANAIFLQYTAPIYILIFAPLILKEQFRPKDLITVILCLAGMSLFFLEPDPANALAPDPFSGNIAGLVSGLCFGLYFVTLRHPRSLEQNPAVSVFYGNVIIVLVMIPLLVLSPPEVSAIDLSSVAYLGIFQIGVAYILFTNGLARGVRSLDASIIGFIEPLLNPVWVLLFLGERPSSWALLGGTVILSGVLLHTLLMQRRRRRVSGER